MIDEKNWASPFEKMTRSWKMIKHWELFQVEGESKKTDAYM